MKNIFALNKNDENLDVDKYIIRSVEDTNDEELDKLDEESQKLIKKYKTPLWVNILMGILLIAGACCILAMFSKKNSFEANYKDHGYVLYIGIAALAIGIALYIYTYVKDKKIDKNPEVQDFVDKSNKIAKKALFELNVPEDAKKIDVLLYNTKTTKNNEEKEVNNFVLNLELYLFKENNNLCLSTLHEVLAFPIDGFKDIVKVKKISFLANWNKNEASNSKKYKEYVKATNYGLRIKYRYLIRLNYEDEELCFFIPDYDLATFLSVLDLEVKEGEINED